MVSPIGGGIAAIGFGAELYGGLEQSKYAHQEAEIEKEKLGISQQEDNTRRAAMELSASRQQTEQTRRMQVNRSAALTASAGSGSQFSSGLQGAYGNIGGQGNVNKQGILMSEQFGERMFDLSTAMNDLKLSQAGIESKKGDAAGISAIGSGLMGLGSKV